MVVVYIDTGIQEIQDKPLLGVGVNSARTRTRAIPTWLLARIAAEAEARYNPQKYRSVYEFFRHHSLTVSKKGPPWRLTERLVGSIRGLPLSFGHLTATNGILCYIENHLGVYQGHMAWFEPVDIEVILEFPKAAKQQPGRKRGHYFASEVDVLLD